MQDYDLMKSEELFEISNCVLISSQTEFNLPVNSKTQNMAFQETDEFDLNTKVSSGLFSQNTNTTDEMNPLHFQVKKLQKLLVVEQDKFTKLQRELHESENQRLELISQNNKEVFNLNHQLSKLRNELEKSEALRQNLEYELSLLKCSFNKEKQAFNGKESLLEEINKNFEDQIRNMNEENSQIKLKLNKLESELSKETNEKLKLETVNKEQDQVINTMKEENSSNKKNSVHLKEQIETFALKEEQLSKQIENLKCLMNSLQTQLENEKSMNQKNQKKIKEQNDLIKKHEEKRAEFELNLEKLMDQFKQTRRDMLEEQTKNRDIKERFKIIESQLRAANFELSKKLEEKVNSIQDLSKQLNVHEANFREVKNELKQTNLKQAELDQTFNYIIQDIEKIQSICTFTVEDTEYDHLKTVKAKEYEKVMKNKNLKETPSVCSTLNSSVSILKLTVEDFKKYFISKINELNQAKTKIEIINNELDSNKKKIQQCDEIKSKCDKEMEILRNERTALEEVIVSQRNECDTLKASLSKEFDQTDQLKAQLNRLSKNNKELDDQKLFLLQSLYNRLVSPSNKQSQSFSDLKNEKKLEEHVIRLIDEMNERLSTSVSKYSNLEKEFIRNEDKLRHIHKKHDEQILKFTILIKEKENYYIKQKDSLVAYYEQLLNDVNSRVKLYIEGYMMTPQSIWHSQYSAGEAWEKLKESDNVTKSLETECNSLKEVLNRTQKNLRNQTTSSLILLGILKTVFKQNKELKEQRHALEMIYLNWSKIVEEKNIDFDFERKKKKLKSTKNASDKFELADAVDFSISSSVCSASNESFTDSALSLRHVPDKKKAKNKLSGLFRKVAIAIIAANRLFFFSAISKSNRLCLVDLNTNSFYQFDYFENKIKNSDVNKMNFSSIVFPNSNNKTNIDEITNSLMLNSLVSWFTLSNENEQLNQLNQISNDLNHYLFNEDIYLNEVDKSLHSDSNLIELAKQSILKFFFILKPNEKTAKIKESSFILAKKLNNGLDNLCKKQPSIAVRYSFKKKLEIINGKLFNSKVINDKIELKTSVPKAKFDSLCHELKLALDREKQAQNLLYQQSCQMEDLSKKLAELSSNELKSFKLKEPLNNGSNKDLIKQLNKKISNLQIMKENYENSACSILMDKDLFLKYCQNIEDIIQKALNNQNSKDLKYIIVMVKQISNISFSSNSNLKLSPESLACKNLINLFCAILLKSIESEVNIKESVFKPTLDNSVSTTENLSNSENESDTSFQQLPNYKINE